jgi:hypothetical protein
MKGLSLEEINELFGDPVAVYITHHSSGDKNTSEEVEDVEAPAEKIA